MFEPNVSPIATLKGHGRLEMGYFTVVEDYVLLDSGASSTALIKIGQRCKLKHGAVIRTYDGHVELGSRVTVGEYSVLAGHGGLFIGDCTAIAAHCYISAANHIYSDSSPIRFQGETARGIHIGRNVWIGGHVMILDGVIIGDNVVIGACSLVTKSLPANSICFGNPCKVVRMK